MGKTEISKEGDNEKINKYWQLLFYVFKNYFIDLQSIVNKDQYLEFIRNYL